ncbi:pilus assembly FimT family protein [Hyphobacterium sp.]|uniref:pilus assembly FimT family protein n=1 Tax=Hyphobacterium sp. TaxID=2004662 RepID=UPI003BAD026D
MTRSLASNRGYSLVEIMVVLTLIGLMTGVAFLTLRPDSDPARSAAEQLLLDLSQAETLAVTRGEFIGIRVRSDGYDFLAYTRGAWVPLTGRRNLSGRALAEGISLRVQGQAIAGGTDLPDYWFDPTGANDRARLEIRTDETFWQIDIGQRDGLRLSGGPA